MTTRQRIEASREIRLWVGQILVPVTTLAVTAMTVPEVRAGVIQKAKKTKESFANKFRKKEEKGS